MSWYIKRAYWRDLYNVHTIDDCQNCSEEVFFGFIESSLECDAQLSFNFNTYRGEN